MKKIKALHICNFAAPYKGNFINSLLALESNEEIENFYLFPTLAYTSGAKAWISELNQYNKCAYIQERNFIDAFFQLKKILKNHRIDVVVMHFSDIRADILVKLAFKDRRVIRFFHNTYRPRRKVIHILRSILWKKNIMVGVSEFVSKELKKFFKQQKIVTIINAIDFERLNKFVSLDKEAGIVLTMMGWDQKGKGVDLVLEASSQLRKKYDIKLNIVAAINSDSLKQLIGKEQSWIRVLTPRHDIATYYNISDIFVSASRAEAFGYSVVEAAYCGNSIIASRVDGQAELKIKGTYWFESENTNELIECIENAIIDLQTKNKKKEKQIVKVEVEDEYSLQKWSRKVKELMNYTIGW